MDFLKITDMRKEMNAEEYFQLLRDNGLTPRGQLLECVKLCREWGGEFLNTIADRLEVFDNCMMTGTMYKIGRSTKEPLDELLTIYCDCITSLWHNDMNDGGRIVYDNLPKEEKEHRRFMYYELSDVNMRMKARWNNYEEYEPGIKPPVKKKFDLDELPYFDDMPEGYYKKYDNYDAINVDKTKEIPIDYTGIMGIPITALDNAEIMAHMEIMGYKRPIVEGKNKFFRIFCRWTWEKELNAFLTGEPVVVSGAYHDAFRPAEERGLEIQIQKCCSGVIS